MEEYSGLNGDLEYLDESLELKVNNDGNDTFNEGLEFSYETNSKFCTKSDTGSEGKADINDKVNKNISLDSSTSLDDETQGNNNGLGKFNVR